MVTYRTKGGHCCYHNLLMVIFRLFLSKRNDFWHFLLIFVPVNH